MAREPELDVDLNEGVGENVKVPLLPINLKPNERVTVKCRLKSIVKDTKAYKGSCFWVNLDVLESSDENKAGTGEHRINLKVATQKQREFSFKDLRHIVAACNKTNPEDKDIDYNPMLIDIITAGEDVEQLDLQFAVDLVAGKNPVLDDSKEDTGLVWANRYFKAIA